jgi:hypothetical protein
LRSSSTMTKVRYLVLCSPARYWTGFAGDVDRTSRPWRCRLALVYNDDTGGGFYLFQQLDSSRVQGRVLTGFQTNKVRRGAKIAPGAASLARFMSPQASLSQIWVWTSNELDEERGEEIAPGVAEWDRGYLEQDSAKWPNGCSCKSTTEPMWTAAQHHRGWHAGGWHVEPTSSGSTCQWLHVTMRNVRGGWSVVFLSWKGDWRIRGIKTTIIQVKFIKWYCFMFFKLKSITFLQVDYHLRKSHI